MKFINIHHLATCMLVSLVQTNIAGPCSAPIDSQCQANCYYLYGGECLACANCSKEQLGHPEYHKRECRTFPKFCGGFHSGSTGEYPTDYTPINLPEPHGVFYGNNGIWLLMFYQKTRPIVAKLCMYEYQITTRQEDWFTLQSACLNITGADGTKYDHLEDVKNHSYNASVKPVHFYVASSTDELGNTKSSVAWLDETVLKKVFRSNQYLEDPDYDEPDERRLEGSLPKGRNAAIGGYCPNRPSEPLPDQEKNFLREHPLMFNEINATAGVTSNGSGFLFEGWGKYTTLDTVEKKAQDGVYNKILFIGTEDGRLLKIILDDKMTGSTLLEENYLTESPTLGIVSVMVIVQNENRKLNITTSDGKFQILDTERCKERNTQCFCEQDPFCYFTGGGCKPFDWNIVLGTGGAPIPKAWCDEGTMPGPHIVDPYDRAFIPTTAAKPSKPEVGESSGEKEVDQGQHVTTAGLTAWIILFVVVATLVFLVLTAGTYAYSRWKRYRYWKIPTEDDLERTWTSISFLKKYRNWGDTLLKDGDEERPGTETNGKIVFANLTPKTEYKISCNGRLIPYSTSGPVFGAHILGKDHYSVEVSGWVHQDMNAVISLRNGETGYSKSKMIDGGSLHMPALPPNMSFQVFLVLETKDGRRFVCEKMIENIETHPEEFTITDDSTLTWGSLSRTVQGLTISSCRCISQMTFPKPATSGHVTLPPLPFGVTCLFTIKGIFKQGDTDGGEFVHIIGTVKHNTPKMDKVRKRTPSHESEVVSPPERPHHSEDSGIIRSAPMLSLPPSSDVSIPNKDLQYAASLMQRSISSGGDPRVMVGSNSTFIQGSTVHFHAGPSSTSNSIREPSSLVTGPLKSSDSVIQLQNNEYSCSKTMEDILKLEVEQKQEISLKLRVSPLMLKAFCEVLDYSHTEQEVFCQDIQQNGNEGLKPLMEREGQLREVTLSILLFKLMACLKSITRDTDGDQRKEAERLHWMVDFLVKEVHKEECFVCKEICKSCDHLFKCR